jgi:hypothetical protein
VKRSEEKANCKMGYSSQSAVLRRQIEAKLASRIPAALSPQSLQAPRLMSSGVPEVDGLLGGGMPIGGVTEFTGLASSGRTSLAFSLLAGATTDSACAYIGYANGKQLAAVLLVDQSCTETPFGNARSYAEAIRSTLQNLEFPSNVAVAPKAEASLLLARRYTGVIQVDAKDVQAKLAPLPLSMLTVEASTLAALGPWGIRNLGELAALPETALVSRIGHQGKRLQRLAVEREDHLLLPQDPSFVLSEHVELDGPLDSLEPLLFILSPMLETLLRQALNHAYALRSVTVTLFLEKASPHRLEVRPAVPVQSKELLLKLLHLSCRLILHGPVSSDSPWTRSQRPADRATGLVPSSVSRILDRDGLYGAPRLYMTAKKLGLRSHIGAEISTGKFGNQVLPESGQPHPIRNGR